MWNSVHNLYALDFFKTLILHGESSFASRHHLLPYHFIEQVQKGVQGVQLYT